MLAAAFCLPALGLAEELAKNAREGAMFFEITEVRPLG